MSEPRFNATAAVIDEKIFVIGGNYTNGDFAETIEVWDQEWKLTSIAFSISQACCVANED